MAEARIETAFDSSDHRGVPCWIIDSRRMLSATRHLAADVEDQVRVMVAGNARDTMPQPRSVRFPPPWRITEIPNRFAVDDATGRQPGVFCGRADPNTVLRSISPSYRNAQIDFSLQRRCESHASAAVANPRCSGGESKTYSKATRAPYRLVRTPRAAAEHKRARTAINVRNEKTLNQGYSRPIQ
jgi:hypothetical protein